MRSLWGKYVQRVGWTIFAAPGFFSSASNRSFATTLSLACDDKPAISTLCDCAISSVGNTVVVVTVGHLMLLPTSRSNRRRRKRMMQPVERENRNLYTSTVSTIMHLPPTDQQCHEKLIRNSTTNLLVDEHQPALRLAAMLVRCGRTKNSAACFVVQHEVLRLVVYYC
jgi:hypothetical protein